MLNTEPIRYPVPESPTCAEYCIGSVLSTCRGLPGQGTVSAQYSAHVGDSRDRVLYRLSTQRMPGTPDRVLYRLSTQHMSGTPGQGTVWSQYSAHVGDSRDRVLYRLSIQHMSGTPGQGAEPIQHPVP